MFGVNGQKKKKKTALKKHMENKVVEYKLMVKKEVKEMKEKKKFCFDWCVC